MSLESRRCAWYGARVRRRHDRRAPDEAAHGRHDDSRACRRSLGVAGAGSDEAESAPSDDEEQQKRNAVMPLDTQRHGETPHIGASSTINVASLVASSPGEELPERLSSLGDESLLTRYRRLPPLPMKSCPCGPPLSATDAIQLCAVGCPLSR